MRARTQLWSSIAVGILIGCGAGGGNGEEPTPPVISTATLPGGTAGAAYSATLAATGGTAPYSWTVVAPGTLPAGLTLGASSGVISGTPGAAGTASFTVRVSDSSAPPLSATKALSIAVAAPLAVATTALPAATTGVAYAATLAATGGTPPYAWSISAGSLPAGLALDPGTGAVSGTSTSVGTAAFTVRVADAFSPQRIATRALSIAVGAPLTGPLAVTTTFLPIARTGEAYTAALAAAGGTSPYTWAVASGFALPPGLSLTPSTGAIGGAPTTATQGRTVRVAVVDSSSPVQQVFADLILHVEHGSLLAISVSALPSGVTGQAYRLDLAAGGGKAPYAWSIQPGYQLPAGLTLDPATGAIAGTPTTATPGPLPVRVRVTDASLPVQEDFADLSIAVDHASRLQVATSALPPGVTDQAYRADLTTNGGTTPYAWSIQPGYQLPVGLTLDSSTGAITGTPTTATPGPIPVRVRVTDGSRPVQEDFADLTLAVGYGSILSLTTSALPVGAPGSSYSATLAASGGKPPYSWSVPPGWQLPPGFVLDPASGTISGTPAGPVIFNTRFQVADSSAPAQTDFADLLFVIDAAPSLMVTTSRLPAAATGLPVSVALAAAGGTPPYSAWTVVSGTPPPGLALAPSGVLSGTPTTQGSWFFNVQVTDASPSTTQQALFLEVRYASTLAVNASHLPDATAGSPFSLQLDRSGGVPPFSWTVVSGAVPAGLSLTSSGRLSGTPSTQGTSSFTVQVEDSSSPRQAASQTFFMEVRYPSALAIATTHLPDGVTGEPFSVQLAVQGGAAPYSWTVSSGSPPPGLTLSSNGLLSGTPTAQGQSAFTAQVTDASSPPQTTSVSLFPIVRYASTLRLLTAHVPEATVGAPYSLPLTASGGKPPYTWSVSGFIPGGMTFDQASGAISGTPNGVGSGTVSVSVGDASLPPQADSTTLTLTVR